MHNTCPACGKELVDHSRFFRYCGAPLTDVRRRRWPFNKTRTWLQTLLLLSAVVTLVGTVTVPLDDEMIILIWPPITVLSLALIWIGRGTGIYPAWLTGVAQIVLWTLLGFAAEMVRDIEVLYLITVVWFFACIPLYIWILVSVPDSADEWACRECGYSLVGLQGDRCPECGTLFQPPVPDRNRRRIEVDHE